MALSKITTGSLADAAITTDKIANSAINSAKIGVDVITAEDLAANSITVAELTNGAVTPAKLSTGAPYWDASSNVGIGTTSPNSYAGFSTLTLNNTTGGEIDFEKAGTVNGSIYTPSGGDNFAITAANVSGSLLLQSGGYITRATLDASGNLGIGTSTIGSAGVSLNNEYNIGWAQSAGESVPNIFRQASSAATVVANGYRYTATSNGFASSFSSSFAKSAISVGDGSVRFYTDTAATTAAGTDVTPTERMRIDSGGNLLVGKTSDTSAVTTQGVNIRDNGSIIVNTAAHGASPIYVCRDANGDLITFFRDGVVRGEIVANTSSVSYNTTSDYRLKENVVGLGNASSRVLQLNPVRFNFIGDSDTVDGFLAHEAQAVVPEAVTGERDAVNEDGSPNYQGIDQSKLVPLLTAALQEALAEINSLKARLDATNL